MLKKANVDEILAMLPKRAVDLVEILGADVAVLFIKAFGGRSFLGWVSAGEFVEISKVIGKVNAQKIRQYAKSIKQKGKYLYIPRCVALLSAYGGYNQPKKGAFLYSEDLKPFLPDLALELLGVLEEGEFEKLINTLGGRYVRIPSNKNSVHFGKLAQYIGEQSALKLCDYFRHSVKIYIPSCRRAVCELHNRKIVKEYEVLIKANNNDLFVVSKLAIKYKLADRTIRDILKRTVI